MALKAGANLLGLVSEMPSGPGVISLDEIAKIVAGLPSDTRTVLLTSNTSSQDIIFQHKQVKTWGIQLVDKMSLGELKKLKILLPETVLIQVVHVTDSSAVEEAKYYENNVDYLLLDSGQPSAGIRTLGGTGNVHDWHISREICEGVSTPVFLAGGLSSSNIFEAIQQVQPAGVDLCSKLRTGGLLDREKLNLFMQKIPNKRNTSNEIC